MVISKALGCCCTPVNRVVPMPLWPTNENCTPILFVRLCRICVPGRCAEPLNASGRLPRLSALGDQWAAICPGGRLGRSLLVGPCPCAQPVATLHVCSTPHVGGGCTAGYIHQRPRCAPGPGIVSPGHMKYHTSPLVMLGIGVRASCHSWARTILVYCASMKSLSPPPPPPNYFAAFGQ